jgi:hypothetical protein
LKQKQFWVMIVVDMDIRRFTLIATISVFFTACFSGPVTIPDDATAAEIVQMGQAAMDRNRYSQAIKYYDAIRARFPENLEAVAGADYEIAFIHYKQQKYDDARNEFAALLEKYNTPDGAALPKKYQILSNAVLAKIPEPAPLPAEPAPPPAEPAPPPVELEPLPAELEPSPPEPAP